MKYPLLLVHGMGFRDSKIINYWGRIPKALEKMGCRIYYGYQDSNAAVETNGQTIAKRINEIIEETGADKVNVIAHSKGGLDTRYAISTLHVGDKVASLTTINTPHNGSKTVDLLMKLPRPLVRFIGFCTDCWFRVLGDKKPSSYRVFHSLTTKGAGTFNRNNPDREGIYYQSYAFVMKKPTSDIFLCLTNLVVGIIEGENDGLLTPDAVRWTNFRGIYRGAGNRGISHCDEVDMRRRPLSRKTGEGVSDIVDFYQDVVSELCEKGF